MTIGEKIKTARIEKGLTQKKLGVLSGIAEPTIRRYEAGKLNPKKETLKKIADGLGLSPADLIGAEWFDVETGEKRLEQTKKGVSELQAFEGYLKSLGFSVSFEGPSNSDDPDVVLINGKEKTAFTGGQFEAFRKAISDSVNYQIWQQQNR